MKNATKFINTNSINSIIFVIFRPNLAMHMFVFFGVDIVNPMMQVCGLHGHDVSLLDTT
jgi:hypothetical protein